MTYTNVTATGLVSGSGQNTSTGVRGGRIAGFIVNSHTSGTVKINDSQIGTADPVLMDTYTLTAGSGVVAFPEPIEFYDGLYVTIGGTAANLTLVWEHN